MSKGVSLCLRPMDWISPPNPRIWSPWKWLMNILSTFIGLTFASMNCLWVPSPQSKRNTSPNSLMTIAAWFLSLEGTAEDVPKNMISI